MPRKIPNTPTDDGEILGTYIAVTPSPDAVRSAREDARLTQIQAARLIYASMRAWQEWEAGSRSMHPALWELWNYKVGNVEAIQRLKRAKRKIRQP